VAVGLATQLAIGNAEILETPNNFPSSISNQLLAPRIFEVKRSGEILPFAWDGPGVRVSSPQNQDREHEDNSLVADIALLRRALGMELLEGRRPNLETLNIFPRNIPPTFEKAARYYRSPRMDREFVFLPRKIRTGNTRKVADTTPLTEGPRNGPAGRAATGGSRGIEKAHRS
jgi:hypothetical protein